MKGKESPTTEQGTIKKKPPYDNSRSTQRSRLLKLFKSGEALTTMQAKNELGILHPAGRILELRALGHKIATTWVYEVDSNGVTHRVGRYVYMGKECGK